MGQPCTDKIALIEGKHLRLVLKPPKGRAADNPVVILLKLTS